MPWKIKNHFGIYQIGDKRKKLWDMTGNSIYQGGTTHICKEAADDEHDKAEVWVRSHEAISYDVAPPWK